MWRNVCQPMSSPNLASFAARLICDFCKLSWWYGLPVTGLAKTQSSSHGKTEAERQCNSTSARRASSGTSCLEYSVFTSSTLPPTTLL